MTERRASDVVEQLARYGPVLDDAAAETHVTEPHEVRVKHRNRVATVLGAAATVGLVALVVVLLVQGPTRTRPSTRTGASDGFPTGLDVVARLGFRAATLGGIAFDGRDVWVPWEIVVSEPQGDRPIVRLERRQASTGKLLSTTLVQQASMLTIAADGAGSVYLAGGGDGGVPQTTVSKVDAATGKVLYTTTLRERSCSCRLVADRDSVWLGANGSEAVLRLDPATGDIIAIVPVPAKAFALALVGGWPEVGLADGTLVVIDPRGNTIAHTTPVESSRAPRYGSVTAITPFEGSPGVWDSWVTRSDGATFLSVQSEGPVVGPVGTTARVEGIAWFDDLLYGVNGRVVVVRPTRGETQGIVWFDRTTGRFEPLKKLQPSADFPPLPAFDGFHEIVAAGDTLWISDVADRGAVLVVHPRTVTQPSRAPQRGVTVMGILRMGGGPPPPVDIPIAGTVTATSSSGKRVSAVVGSEGTFTMQLAPGVYDFIGRSPKYLGGNGDCGTFGSVTLPGPSVRSQGNGFAVVRVECEMS